MYLYRICTHKKKRGTFYNNPQVKEEAENGKMYVRGHDREGRPIIHYSPGKEKSFNSEEVRRCVRCFVLALLRALLRAFLSLPFCFESKLDIPLCPESKLDMIFSYTVLHGTCRW